MPAELVELHVAEVFASEWDPLAARLRKRLPDDLTETRRKHMAGSCTDTLLRVATFLGMKYKDGVLFTGHVQTLVGRQVARLRGRRPNAHPVAFQPMEGNAGDPLVAIAADILAKGPKGNGKGCKRPKAEAKGEPNAKAKVHISIAEREGAKAELASEGAKEAAAAAVVGHTVHAFCIPLLVVVLQSRLQSGSLNGVLQMTAF